MTKNKFEFAPVSPSLIQSPTATITGLIAFVSAILIILQVDVSAVAVAAGVIVPCGIVSAFNRRWATDRGLFFQHPALFTASLGYLIWFGAAAIFGLSLDQSIVYVVIGGAASLIGFMFPKNGRPKWFLFLFGPDLRDATVDDAIEVGPDEDLGT